VTGSSARISMPMHPCPGAGAITDNGHHDRVAL
jgi:hypothetical protein